VRHKEELFQGSHEALISKETFDQVETNLRKNSGRSKPWPHIRKGTISSRE
jgi:hypothetical protein